MNERINLILGIFCLSLACATTPVLAQINEEDSPAETTSGNVTAKVAPQGTSLGATNNASSPEKITTSTSGNVTAKVAPQGTSLGATNKSS
ncbi:MAG TPA: hypothetical protein VIP70_04490 [Nitrososphaeraceae archaeon]|jgi:hypothetical protein